MVATARGASSPSVRRASTGRTRVDRPLPAPKLAATFAPVPHRLIRDPGLSPTAKLVASVLCGLGEPAHHAVQRSNQQIADACGICYRHAIRALEELEAAGWVYRLMRDQDDVLDYLLWQGYTSPWAGPSAVQPQRALVLLWRLPEPSPDRREVAPDGNPGVAQDVIEEEIRSAMDAEFGGGSARRGRVA